LAGQDQVFTKCAWRLIPFMMLLYVVNFIDRSNVGFAALTMNKDLGFSPSVYGFASGVFFIGYLLFQVPATVLLERVGARRLIFGIMLIWGLISASNAFVWNAHAFYTLRFVLGVAEAGFFPGMMFYLTLWFPKTLRGRYCAMFSSAIPLAGIIAGPLSGVVLGLDGIAGLHGWQWLFLLQGLPASLLAFVVVTYLPDRPAQAPWLDDDEKDSIATTLAPAAAADESNVWKSLRDHRVLVLGIAAVANGSALYAVSLWLPQIIQAMGFSNRATGFISALPYMAAMAAMIFWGKRSDATGERIWHVALAALFAAAGFVLASVTHNHALMFLGLLFALVGVLSAFGPFYSLSSSFLTGAGAAAGIALINSIANLGGFLGPVLVGILKERTGGYQAAYATLAIGLMLAALMVVLLGRAMALRSVTTESAA
jgi:ACS family tartrate transporter-like MFS transporter